MRSQGARTLKLTPIDEELRTRPQEYIDPPHSRRESSDDRLIRMHIRSERSAAFWMAASIWGVSGLIIGACLGAYMTFQAYTGVTPIVRDNLMSGAAMDSARETVNNRPSLVDREINPPSQ